jgi:hypothetical protein
MSELAILEAPETTPASELEQAYWLAHKAISDAFPKINGIYVSHSLSDFGNRNLRLTWSITAYAPSHFNGEGATIQEAIDRAIKAGRKANADRCPTCDGIASKCGHQGQHDDSDQT